MQVLHQLSRETQVQVLSQLFNPLDQLEELKSENAAVRSFLDQAAGNFVIFQFFL